MSLRDGPARVLIVRHAEKPQDGDDPHLSELGRQRARALARRLPVLFPWIGFLFAAAPSPTSSRPGETLAPIAQLLGLPVDCRFDEHKPAALAGELRNASGRYAQTDVLVCWRHDGMGTLARALGASDAPDRWDEDIYDRLWIISHEPGETVRFEDRALPLLPEDAAQ